MSLSHSRPYPKPGRDGVKSTLKLYPPSDGALPHPNYSVLLLQKNKAHSTAFVLYESDSGQDATAQRDDALKQFAVIHKTLKPLIEDGVLMLSTHLLNMLNFEDTELTESEVSLYMDLWFLLWLYYTAWAVQWYRSSL